MIYLTDGTTIVPFIPAQDYKRLHDGDQGPNTGGMGSFAPAELEEKEEIFKTITKPTIDGMRLEGAPYMGALYVQVILTQDGPKVIEFNSRFGDPETQPQMLLFSADLYQALMACTDGTLTYNHVSFRDGFALCVVLASEGYPQNPVVGREIHGLDKVTDPNVVVFHSATEIKDGKMLTTGGRVLGITAYGQTLEEARQRAYSQIGEQGLHFDGMQFRLDIGINQQSTINN
jgi:phosphoribosylamine--glycine ligase